MSRPRFLLDCDGILSDFITPALAVVASLGGPVLAHDDLKIWDIDHLLPEEKRLDYKRRVSARGFCLALEPYPGAQDAVEALGEMGEVVIVTANMRDAPTWTFEREAWLSERFDIPRSHVVNIHSKHFVGGDLFIDDHPDHVDSWTRAHPHATALLYDRPYNRAAVLAPRARGWDDVLTAATAIVAAKGNARS